MSNVPDQADLHAQGKPLPDAKANVRPISQNVPRVRTVLDLLSASVKNLNEPLKLGCTTGNSELDRITGGFRPGFTWLFGATTSWGKSSWLISVVDENIRRRRKRVLIVSSEDTEEVYGDRLMVRRAKVNAIRYRNRRLEDFELERVNAALEEAEEVPVFVDARQDKIEDLAPHLRTIIRERKIDIVAFDYVQEFKTKQRYQDERVKFREIASLMRHITKDAKIAGIIFSQLTTNERTKVPTRDNIRESRDMANAAEVIVLGFEPDADIASGEKHIAEGDKCVFIDKVKNGPRNCILRLPWNNDGAYFEAVASAEDLALEEDARRYAEMGNFAADDPRYP